jgi:hypothetical protein
MSSPYDRAAQALAVLIEADRKNVPAALPTAVSQSPVTDGADRGNLETRAS